MSLDTAAYGREAEITAKPFVFKVDRLTLNLDTDAVGCVQAGFLDEEGRSIPGFSVEDCVCLNGDFIRAEVEWIKNRSRLEDFRVVSEDSEAFVREVRSSRDVSELEGGTVQLVFPMRVAKLYAMHFVEE